MSRLLALYHRILSSRPGCFLAGGDGDEDPIKTDISLVFVKKINLKQHNSARHLKRKGSRYYG